MADMNGLSQFIQSNSGQLLIGLFTLIGALIGAASAIIVMCLSLRYYKRKDEKERKSLLQAAYNALISEIKTNMEYFESGIGKTLDEAKGPLLTRGAFDWDHDIMYKANAQTICYIPDYELIQAVVKLYGIWGALKDAVQKHNAEIDRRIRIDIEMASMIPPAAKKHFLDQIDKTSIEPLTKMMQSCYKETKNQVKLVLQKLNTQIDLQ